jgi:signal transduction histidine kinase
LERDGEQGPSGGDATPEAAWRAERAARREAEASAARIARLQAATAALSGARTPDEVAEVALGAAIAALGGAGGAVLVPCVGGALRVLRGSGVRDEAALAGAAARISPTAAGGAAAQQVEVQDLAALAGGDPPLAALARALGGAALVELPLAFEGRVLGVLAVTFAAPRPLDRADRALALAVAGQCGQALERARLFVAERLARAEAVAAHGRLAFLDALSAHLAESGGEEDLLRGVARLAVPALGDWAGVFVATEGRPVARAASAGAETLGAAVEAHLRADPRGRLAAACGGGGAATVDDLPARPDGARPAAAVVPLCVKGRSLGAIAVASADLGRAGDSADLALLAEVAHRAALAVEHGRLLRDATLAAQAREDFLHVASHELRSPLATLRLTIDLLTRDLAKGGGAAQARLRAIARQASRLARLSDTLLDVSRITAGRLELAPEEGDLAALARDVAARLAADAPVPEVVIEAPTPVRCVFDAGRMDQVVSNLLSNAIKYGAGRPIRLAVLREGAFARLEVEDRGIGIAPELQDRIFGRFERAVSGREYPGLGLGLWIVRRLVEAHGGTIRLRSAPREGATFTVELPADP